MRVFVTGAAGFVGSAVVQILVEEGHHVIGLVRSEAGAAAVAAAGAEVQLGTLEDLDGLRDGAAKADGVIHTAFNHDWSKLIDNCRADRRAIEAMGAELEGSDRPIIVTSGVALLTPGRVATEQDIRPAASPSFPRESETAAAALAARGVHASVVRLAPSVHGDGDHGFIPRLIGFARDKGVSAYVGDGLNLWPAVHRLDAARVYCLALERGAAGAIYHAVAEEGVPFKDIATVIGTRLGVEVAAKSPAEAEGHFGWFAPFAGMDVPASSRDTRKQLGWAPQWPALIPDIDRPAYFPESGGANK